MYEHRHNADGDARDMPVRVGQVRPSQLLWAYGPGSIVDLPNFSVMTMGIDGWDDKKMRTIVEPRLLREIQKTLPFVKELKAPPVPKEEYRSPYNPEAFVGVPVRPFPRWLRCTKCNYLGLYQEDEQIFKVKGEGPYPERIRFVHVACQKSNKEPEAIPVRFIVACENGHVDDFPWREFVHYGNECQSGQPGKLSFITARSGARIEDIVIKCSCGASRALRAAFLTNFEGFKCRGRHFHLKSFDEKECDKEPRVLLVGASNSWFPITLDALAIPSKPTSEESLVEEHWGALAQFSTESREEFRIGFKYVMNMEGNEKLKEFTFGNPGKIDKLFDAIKKYDGGDKSEKEPVDLKTPEWNVLVDPDPVTDYPNFLSEKAGQPKGYEDRICDVRLLKRLRKVNALVGFSRIEASDKFINEQGDTTRRVPLSLNKTPWVPAIEVHGEGVFVRFNEEKISEWEESEEVRKRNWELREGCCEWAKAHNLDGDVGYPGARYVMLHTLSHLLIREMALECGYAEASLQERVYASSGPIPMAGFLIYTASSDSDGTLGGLVELGEPERLGRLLSQALRRALICSSDPFCSSHDCEADGTLHGASCHSCSFVSETSCENGNRYLDRALLVRTFETENAAFFPELK